MRWWILSCVALLLAACASAAPPPPSTTRPPDLETTTTVATTDEICRIGDLRFTDTGLVGAVGADEGNASTLTEVRWNDSATCERITLVFASGSGAPAGSLGPANASLLPSAGILHIDLPPEVEITAVADTLPEGDLVERIFVVRDDDGQLSVDIHAAGGQAIGARVFTTESPATLVVDIIPTDTVVAPVGAAVSPTVILVTPPSGPTIYPFSVEGYAAPGSQGMTIQLSHQGTTTRDRTLSLPGWTDAWQRISTPLSDGPSGEVTLFVGTLTDEGIRDRGATVVLDLP
jgi:hypothetical protein